MKRLNVFSAIFLSYLLLLQPFFTLVSSASYGNINSYSETIRSKGNNSAQDSLMEDDNLRPYQPVTEVVHQLPQKKINKDAFGKLPFYLLKTGYR